eukprot:8823273-Ditylum_brightwellii.AAC.1
MHGELLRQLHVKTVIEGRTAAVVREGETMGSRWETLVVQTRIPVGTYMQLIYRKFGLFGNGQNPVEIK